MSDALLTNQQAEKLLLELATNDGFRDRFERDPASVLLELNVPREIIDKFDTICLKPTRLASKAEFAAAHEKFRGEAGHWCSKMIVPTLRLTTSPKP